MAVYLVVEITRCSLPNNTGMYGTPLYRSGVIKYDLIYYDPDFLVRRGKGRIMEILVMYSI